MRVEGGYLSFTCGILVASKCKDLSSLGAKTNSVPTNKQRKMIEQIWVQIDIDNAKFLPFSINYSPGNLRYESRLERKKGLSLLFRRTQVDW